MLSAIYSLLLIVILLPIEPLRAPEFRLRFISNVEFLDIQLKNQYRHYHQKYKNQILARSERPAIRTN